MVIRVQQTKKLNTDNTSVSLFTGNTRNPQTESFLQFLELPYLLDNLFESSAVVESPVSLFHGGKNLFLSARGS